MKTSTTLTDSVLRLARSGYSDEAIAAVFRLTIAAVAAMRTTGHVRRGSGKVRPNKALARRSARKLPARKLPPVAPWTRQDEIGGPLEQPQGVDDQWRRALRGRIFTDVAMKNGGGRILPGRMALPPTYLPSHSSLGAAGEGAL